MASNQQSSFGRLDQKSPQPINNTVSGQQMYTISSEGNQASYGETGYWQTMPAGPQVNHYQMPFQMQNIQSLQSLAGAAYPTSNLPVQFNPAMPIMNQWTPSSLMYGGGYSAPQYYAQQTFVNAEDNANMEHQPLNSYDNNYTDDNYEDNNTDYYMEDNPSAQLMAELNDTACSPTPEPTETYDNVHQDQEEVWSEPMQDTRDDAYDNVYQGQHQGEVWGERVQEILDDNHMYPGPAEMWSHRMEDSRDEAWPSLPLAEHFQGFVTEIDEAQEEDGWENEQLDEQVDQVVKNFNDEHMQDYIAPEHEIVVSNTSEYQNMAPREDFDEDVAIGEDEEDVTVDHEPSVSTSTTEQLTSASDEAVEESEMEGLSSDVEAGAESCEDQQNRKSTVNKTDTFEFEGHTLRRRPMTTVKTKAIKKEDKDLHLKASKLIPHHLPETRYWAAVLMHTIQPHKAKNEKDFIWLKGSRINTVETIWQKYREVTTEERHQLLFCDDEVLQFEDTLEELDLFNDKLVVFRAFVKPPKEVIQID